MVIKMKKPPPVAIMSDLIVFPALSLKEMVSLTSFLYLFLLREWLVALFMVIMIHNMVHYKNILRGQNVTVQFFISLMLKSFYSTHCGQQGSAR